MSRTKNYSDFLTSWGALVGVPVSRLSTEDAAVANACFNTAMNQMWSAGPWLDICPYGEARFAGNKLTYSNDVSQTSVWTATALTITANNLVNPLDGRTTASKMLETTANSGHNIVQAFTLLPATQYTFSAYVRANGRNHVYLKLDDGTTAFSAFYNLATGAVGTVANASSTTITAQPNGFYLCSMTFTSTNTAAASKNFQLSLSTDGSTLSYAGTATLGVYVWGCQVLQQSNTTSVDSLIAWEQTGEEIIDVVFDVWKNSPLLSTYPRGQGYVLTPNGIQLINAGSNLSYVNGVATGGTFPVTNNPVFLYYRKSMPSYTGTTFDATDTYVVGEQIYYTNTAGNGNFYKCLVATTGQDPDDTPASWEIIPIYEVFFQYAVYQAYGDWLISDGQMDKAQGAYAIAQSKMDTEFDKRERQMGDLLPLRVSTHLTSRSP